MSDARRHLPVVPTASSLNPDGSRNRVHPADVSGRFVRWRYVVFAALVAIWAAAPWVRINGRPAVFLDVARRQFFLFGGAFNAQDVWLMFFVLTAIGLSLVAVTTTLGRVWCGWACPQTVFLEGMFRRIERWVEGPRNARLRRNAAPMSWDKAWRKGLKHALFVLSALFVAHVFLSFFVSMPSMLEMMGRSPAEHPEAFGWVMVVSALLYGNFAFFREQLCLIVCPYGRLQSVLTDEDSMVVGYDAVRGEPRGKPRDPDAGDCVDCKRCVVVCPTGIDIRNGLQLDCIGCTACIDACDAVMDKLGRPRGLVRYDSMNGLRHRAKRVFRPRLLLYGGLILAWAVGAWAAFGAHTSFEANLLRLRGAPFHLVDDGEVVRNLFTVHLVNKADEAATFRVEAADGSPGVATIEPATRRVRALGDADISVRVDVPRGERAAGQQVRLRVSRDGEEPTVLEAPILGPAR